jgi:hypothetical protein
MPVEKRSPRHYVNNKEFSEAVVQHVKAVNEADAAGDEPPEVPNYIAECFLKIAEGLSHKANFVRYTYREEMVMDAVENCLKAVRNYNIDTATRSGNPNAFAYFTQISYYAFLRRLQKEKRQHDIRSKYIDQSGLEDFIEVTNDQNVNSESTSFVESLRERIDQVHYRDQVLKDFEREYKRQEKEGTEDHEEKGE